MTDPIDKAIAVTEPAPAEVQMRQFNVTISSTGRPAVFVVPVDATDAEILELATHFTSFIAAECRQARQGPASRLVVARGNIPH